MEECWAFHPQQRPSFHQIAGRLHSMLVANHAEAASDVGGETSETQSENSLMLPDRQERERSGNANIVNWKRQKPLEGYPELPPPGNSQGVVLYMTTLGGVRRTFEACERARLVLEVHAVEAGVEVDKRDVWLHREFLKELRELLGMGVAVPQLFIRGKYIGGVDEIVELSEAGKLREMMKSG